MLIEFIGLFRTWDDDGVRDVEDYKQMPISIDAGQIESINQSTFKGVCTVWTKSGKSHLLCGMRRDLMEIVNNAKKDEALCYLIRNTSN